MALSLYLLADLVELLLQPGVQWKNVSSTFVPRKEIPTHKTPVIQFVDTLPEDFQAVDVFLKLFPKSLFMWIANCTNERLEILAKKKGKEIKPTDCYEMMIVIGCYIIMAYNRVPAMNMYFSNDNSLKNDAMKSAIDRDRFLLLTSKLYYNHPVKTNGCSKVYYMEEIVNCLKYTFQKARSESTFQSIDESMCKCKARTSLKQFMANKPVKRGVKMWMRCDACSGYIYDFNIYAGKADKAQEGTLGEKVVNTLCSTIRDPAEDVAIIVDRFFMSVDLLKKLPHALVGTCMSNRKNVPAIDGKLQRGQSSAKCTDDGIICFKWQDTKEVLVMSNCHTGSISTADRRLKDGTKKTFDCPDAIVFYNKMMGGVDKADQYSTVYDIDRKSNKWWKRVFHRLLQMSVSNSWIIYQELKGKKSPQIDFLTSLQNQLIEIGRSKTENVYKPGRGRPPKKKKFLVAINHQPISVGSRRRCAFCASKKKETRTIYACNTCNVPLCILCFAPYHMN